MPSRGTPERWYRRDLTCLLSLVGSCTFANIKSVLNEYASFVQTGSLPSAGCPRDDGSVLIAFTVRL